MQDIGIIGLGPMGKNLAFNASRSMKVSVYTRSPQTIQKFNVQLQNEKGKTVMMSCTEFKCEEQNCQKKTHETKTSEAENIKSFTNLNEFLESLKAPRLILLFIPSFAVTQFLKGLKPKIDINDNKIANNSIKEKSIINPEDIIADCGNTFYKESITNSEILDCNYCCVGTSGGAMGALKGPAMMVGIGTVDNFHNLVNSQLIKGKNNFFIGKKQKEHESSEKEFSEVAVKKLFDNLNKISPCVTLVGPSYFGHYVKKVHNGIEYAIMSLISEISTALIKKVGISQTTKVFEKFNEKNKMFLVDCLIKVLKKKENGENVFKQVESKTGMKGTGKWCAIEGLKLNTDIGMISSSVFERIKTNDTISDGLISDDSNVENSVNFEIKEENCILTGEAGKENFLTFKQFYDSLLQLIILSYFEGLKLLNCKYDEQNLDLCFETVKNSWRENCVIEANLLFDLVYENSISKKDFLLKTLQKHYNNKDEQIKTECFKNLSKIMTETPSSTYFTGISSFMLENTDVGKILQSIRDVFGEHGVKIDGVNKNVNWD